MDNSAYMSTFPGKMPRHSAPPPHPSSQLHPGFGSMPQDFGSHHPSDHYLGVPHVQQDPRLAVAHQNQAPSLPIYDPYSQFAAPGAQMAFEYGAAPGRNHLELIHTTGHPVFNGPLVQNNYGLFNAHGVHVQAQPTASMHAAPSQHQMPAGHMPPAHKAPSPRTEPFQNVPTTSRHPAHHRYNKNGERLDCWGLTRGQQAARTKVLKKRARKQGRCSYCEQFGHNKTGCRILHPEKAVPAEKGRRKDSKQVTEEPGIQRQYGDVVATRQWPCESVIAEPPQQQHDSQSQAPQAPVGDIAAPNVNTSAHQQHTTQSATQAPPRPSTAAEQVEQQAQDPFDEFFDYEKYASERGKSEEPFVMFEGVEGGKVVIPGWN